MTKYIVTYADLENGILKPYAGPFAFCELFNTTEEALDRIIHDVEECKEDDRDVFDEKTLTLTYFEANPVTHIVYKILPIIIYNDDKVES